MATMEELQTDMKNAMKAKEAQKLGTLRMIIAELKNKKIELQTDLSESDIEAVLQKEAKKRREAADMYKDGGREELAAQEEAELVVIESYLPKQLTDDEIAAIVDEVIAQTGATSKADMGKVMGPVMGKVKGLADGTRVKDAVMSKLN